MSRYTQAPATSTPDRAAQPRPVAGAVEEGEGEGRAEEDRRGIQHDEERAEVVGQHQARRAGRRGRRTAARRRPGRAAPPAAAAPESASAGSPRTKKNHDTPSTSQRRKISEVSCVWYLRVAPAAASSSGATAPYGEPRQAAAQAGAARPREQQEPAEPAAEPVGEQQPHRREHRQQHEGREDVDLLVERVEAVGVVAGSPKDRAAATSPGRRTARSRRSRCATRASGAPARLRRGRAERRCRARTARPRPRPATWKKSGQRMPQLEQPGGLRGAVADPFDVHLREPAEPRPRAARRAAGSGARARACRPICSSSRPATAHSAKYQCALASSSCAAPRFRRRWLSLARALATMLGRRGDDLRRRAERSAALRRVAFGQASPLRLQRRGGAARSRRRRAPRPCRRSARAPAASPRDFASRWRHAQSSGTEARPRAAMP